MISYAPISPLVAFHPGMDKILTEEWHLWDTITLIYSDEYHRPLVGFHPVSIHCETCWGSRPSPNTMSFALPLSSAFPPSPPSSFSSNPHVLAWWICCILPCVNTSTLLWYLWRGSSFYPETSHVLRQTIADGGCRGGCGMRRYTPSQWERAPESVVSLPTHSHHLCTVSKECIDAPLILTPRPFNYFPFLCARMSVRRGFMSPSG